MSDRQTKSDPAADKSMKVTDRRMFTPDGELREEYRHLEDVAAGPPAGAPTEPAPPPAGSGAVAAGEPPKQAAPAPPEPEPETDAPGFIDLVRLLAEHTSIYLQHASMPDGDQRQHLELARLHIDLLGVLKDKTAGNLDAQERALLDDALYQLRMAFAAQRGF